METVTASVNYTVPLDLYKVEKPFFSNVPAPDGRQTNQVAQLYHGIKLHDIRGRQESFNLDKNGFEVFPFGEEEDQSDSFDSDQWIQDEIYPFVESVLKARLGDVDVKIFDHTVRKRRTVQQLKDAQPFVRATRQPSLSAHCGRLSPLIKVQHPSAEPRPIDQTFLSGENRIHFHMGSEASQLLKKRCQIINVWKPLFGPVEDCPLTYCDWRTVNVDRDYMPADLLFPHYIGEQYLVTHHPDHRCYFLGGQRTNEVTLLKCWDSVADVARCVAHTSFIHPNTPKHAKLRESVEFRCMVFHNE